MRVPQFLWRALLCASAMSIAAPQARADSNVVPLGSLIAQSNVIVIGVMSHVTAAGAATNRPHVAHIDIQRTLKGRAGASIELAGDYRDPDGPMAVDGVRVLAFLRGSAPVHAGAGLVDLGDDAAAGQAAAIVTRALANQWAPANYQDVFLRTALRAPRPLVASLLKELTRHLAETDNALLVDAVCDHGDFYLPAMRQWAMAQAGRHKLGGARSCLEDLSAGGKDTRFVEGAIEALGDLGDPRSTPTLLGVLDRAMLAPPADRPRGGAGPLPGAVLALGKIGDASAVPALIEVARQTNSLPLYATLVHALGLIGTPSVDAALDTIGRTHPNSSIREQALTTLQRVARTRARRIQ